eukprot:m51a1_g3854 hypothetical protein (74) ;mRNA; r:393022-393808
MWTSGHLFKATISVGGHRSATSSGKKLWLWLVFKESIDGILVWSSNYWTGGAKYNNSMQDPYEDPTTLLIQPR